MFLDKYADTYSWKDLCSDESFYEIYTMYLQMNITGGSLHIVLDDGNNSDDSIEFCYNYAKERGDVAGMLIDDGFPGSLRRNPASRR